jgi:hypothetical protein
MRGQYLQRRGDLVPWPGGIDGRLKVTLALAATVLLSRYKLNSAWLVLAGVGLGVLKLGLI